MPLYILRPIQLDNIDLQLKEEWRYKIKIAYHIIVVILIYNRSNQFGVHFYLLPELRSIFVKALISMKATTGTTWWISTFYYYALSNCSFNYYIEIQIKPITYLIIDYHENVYVLQVFEFELCCHFNIIVALLFFFDLGEIIELY